MRNYQYLTVLEPNGLGGFIVSFRDVPEALAEARKLGCRALIGALLLYRSEGRAFPEPSAPQENDVLISIPLSVRVKLRILDLMEEGHISRVELARRMSLSSQEVRRLLDPERSCSLDSLEKACTALGRRLEISLAEL